MTGRRKKYDMAGILLKVSGAFGSTLELDRVADLVLKESAEALAVDHASLFLLDEESHHLILTKAIGFTADQLDNLKLLGSWEVINTQVVRRKRTLVVNNIHADSIFKAKRLPFSAEMLPIWSFLAVPLLKRDGAVLGVLIVSNRRRPGHLFVKEDERLLTALSNHIAIAILNAKLYERLKRLFISTVKSLVRAVEAKDSYTSGHSERVMQYSVAIGMELGIGEEKLENLGLSSLLHDVGKIGIGENVLSKPSRLSVEEMDEVIHHPSIGVKIVETIENSGKIIRGILEHHEYFNGKGYPAGLKGSKISLEGRIIAVADAFDALTTDRPYRKKYSNKEALFEIKDNSGTQFDPSIVRAFLLSFSKYHDIWNKK